jgi:hypothetical protein
MPSAPLRPRARSLASSRRPGARRSPIPPTDTISKYLCQRQRFDTVRHPTGKHARNRSRCLILKINPRSADECVRYSPTGQGEEHEGHRPE